MFKLFHRKKKEEAKPQETVAKDRYEVYRLMGPEDLEVAAQEKDAEANRIADKWNSMSEQERDASVELYYEYFNLRKEARFFRELKDNPNASAPALFSVMLIKHENNIRPYEGKWWD